MNSTRLLKLREAIGGIAGAFTWPEMSYGNSGHALFREIESRGNFSFGNPLRCLRADFIVAIIKPIQAFLDERQRNVRRLFLDYEERINHLNDAPRLDEILNSPSPTIQAIFHSSRTTVAKHRADSDPWENHVDHTTVGISNADGNRSRAGRAWARSPNRTFAINDAGQPANPLFTGHFRKRMNSFEYWYRSSHHLSIPQDTRTPQLKSDTTASGWHGRAWRYMPSPPLPSKD